MYIFWRHYCIVKPNCSSFGTFTIIILSVLISRTFTVWRGLRGWGFSRLALVLYENLNFDGVSTYDLRLPVCKACESKARVATQTACSICLI